MLLLDKKPQITILIFMASTTVNLRGHHLLCLLAFRGKGYNRAFINNLAKLQEKIRNDKKIKIKIVEGADDICVQCPYLNGNTCCKEAEERTQKINKIDNNILNKLNFKKNEIITLSDLVKSLSQIPKQELAKLCSSCSWLKTENCPKEIILFIHSFST